MKIIGIFGIFIVVNTVSGYGSFHYSKPPNIPSSYKATSERKEIRPLPPIVKTHLSKAVVVRVPVHKQEQVYSSKSSKENKEEERLVIVVPVPRVAGEKVYEDLELKEIRYQKKEESDFGNQPQNNYESQITSAETDRAPIYNMASKISIVNPHQAQPNLQQPAQNMSYRPQQYFPRGEIKSALPPHSTVVFVGNQQIQNSGSREIELDENRFHSQQPFNFHAKATKRPGSESYHEKDSNRASQYTNSFAIKNSNYGIHHSFPSMNYESGKIGGIDGSHQSSVNKDEFRENMQQPFNPTPNNQSPHNSNRDFNLNEKPVSLEDKDNNPTIQHSHSTLKDINQPSSSRINNYGSQEVKPVRKQQSKKIPVLLITLPHNKRRKTTTTKIQYDSWKPITKENEQILEKVPVRQSLSYSNSQPVNEMNQPEKKTKQYSPQISINFPTSNEGTYGHNEPNFNHGQINHNTQQVYHNQFGSNVFQQQQNKQNIRHNLHQSSELRQQVNQPLHSQKNTQFEYSPIQRGTQHNFNQNPAEQTQHNNNGNAANFNQFPVRNFQLQNFQNSEYKKPISEEKQVQFEYVQNQNNFNQNPIEQSQQQNPIEQSQQNNYNDNDQRYDHSTEPSQAENFQTTEFKQVINQQYPRGENSQVRFEQPTPVSPMVVNQVQNFNQEQLFQQENYNHNIPDNQPPREEFNAQIVPPPNQGQIFQNPEYVQPNNQPFPSLDKSQVRIEPISIPLSQIQPNFNQIQNGESNYNQQQLETTQSPTHQHDVIQKQKDENRSGQKIGKDTEGLLLVLVSTKKYKGDEINPKQQIMARENIEEQNIQLPADMNFSPSDRTSVVSFTKTNDYQTGYSIMY